MASPESAEDTFRFRLNAQHVAVPGPGGRPLGPVLREEHGLVSVKLACDDGSCGLCSVLVDGEAVRSCVYPLGRAAGHVVVTAEGLHTPATLNRIQRAFLKWGVPQCGFCAPAMLIAATELLGTRARPSEAEIRAALSGVLCRCTGYHRIVAAVAEAAGEVDMPLAPATGEAVGHDVPAIDGHTKVTGGLRFAADAVPKNALWLRLVPAHRAPARISVGGFEPLLAAHPDLAAVLTVDDLPSGLKTVAPPLLAEGRVAYRGEPVAALVGSRGALAAVSDAALAIAYEPLPAPPGTAQFATTAVHRGMPERDLAAAACVAEGHFTLDPLTPAPIEIEAGWAEKRDGGLDLHLPFGEGHGAARLLAEALGLAPEKVRIEPATAAGCFGARDGPASALLLGLAAWQLGRPVALMAKPLVPAAETRPSLRIKARLAADRDGRLLAAESDSHLATVAASDLASSLVAGLAAQGAAGPYKFASAAATARAFAEAAPILRASRGLGVVEATLWREALIDDLASRLDLDRLDIRRRNAEAGAEGFAACLDALAPHWQQAANEVAAFNTTGRPRRNAIQGLGLGVAGGALDCGAKPPEAWVRIALERSGRLRLTTNGVETGQGLATALAQVAADTLGVAMTYFVVEPGVALAGEAAVSPQARGVVAFHAAAEAAAALRHQLLDLVTCGTEARFELAGGMLRAIWGGGATEIALSSLPADGAGVILAAEARCASSRLPAAFAAHLAVVEVDPLLGAVLVKRLVAAQDFGRAIHPAHVAGQIEGAVAQAVGYAVMAPLAAPIDRGQTGGGLWSPIPRLGEMPSIELVPIGASACGKGEESSAGLIAPNLVGPKIIGPWAVAASAAAILSAVRHATGLPIRELPATPARLRAALARGNSAS